MKESKKYVVVKGGDVFWGHKERGRWLITFTNVRRFATWLTYSKALELSKFNKGYKILDRKEFEEYPLNHELI